MGSAAQGNNFFETYWASAAAIGDPKQLLHRAFSVNWGSVSQFFKSGVWRAYFEAKSYGVGMPQGNTMRNPGAVLIRDEEIVFSQQFEHFGEPVDTDRVAKWFESQG
jgi:hypothetical protein